MAKEKREFENHLGELKKENSDLEAKLRTVCKDRRELIDQLNDIAAVQCHDIFFEVSLRLPRVTEMREEDKLFLTSTLWVIVKISGFHQDKNGVFFVFVFLFFIYLFIYFYWY